jgi:DNA-binding CsgD family transcriptional regulator/tetratricopeptide (TPR) repeat protein
MPGTSAKTFERAWALNGAGWLAVCQGEPTKGEALNKESLAIGRMLNNPLLISRGLINLGVGAHQRGAEDTARVLFEEALAITRASCDPIGEAMALRNLSSLAVEVGDCRTAELRACEALALGRKLQSEWMQAGALIQLGLAAFGLDMVAAASEILEEGLTAARASRNRNLIASSLDALGNVLLAQNDQRRATALLRESLQLRNDVGDWPHIPTSLESLARAYASTEQLAKSVRLLAIADGLRSSLQRPPTTRECAMAELWLPTVRQRLGDKAFEELWAAGRSATVEQVIADSLSPSDDARPRTTSNRTHPLIATNRLTARECEVVDLVARGLSNRQIAVELVIAERTAENHLRHIFDKLGASSRAQVAAWAVASRAG